MTLSTFINADLATSKNVSEQSTFINHTDESRRAFVVDLYESNFNKYYLVSLKYIGCPQAAYDIVGDIFWDALERWTPERFASIINLRNYIGKAVVTRSLNALKHRRRVGALVFTPTDEKAPRSNPVTEFDYMIDLNLDNLLLKLPKDQGEAFSLLLKGYTHEEIYEKMKLDSIGASKNLVYRAKKKLRKLLADFFQPDPDDSGGSGGVFSVPTRTKKKVFIDGYNSEPSFGEILDYAEGKLSEGTIAYLRVIFWAIMEDLGLEEVSSICKAIKDRESKELRLMLKERKSALAGQLFNREDSSLVTLDDNYIALNRFLTNINNIHQIAKEVKCYPRHQFFFTDICDTTTVEDVVHLHTDSKKPVINWFRSRDELSLRIIVVSKFDNNDTNSGSLLEVRRSLRQLWGQLFIIPLDNRDKTFFLIFSPVKKSPINDLDIYNNKLVHVKSVQQLRNFFIPCESVINKTEYANLLVIKSTLQIEDIEWTVQNIEQLLVNSLVFRDKNLFRIFLGYKIIIDNSEFDNHVLSGRLLRQYHKQPKINLLEKRNKRSHCFYSGYNLTSNNKTILLPEVSNYWKAVTKTDNIDYFFCNAPAEHHT